MAWQLIMHIIIVSEMTFINLYTTNCCSVKKHSEPVIWTVFILFSAALFGSAMPLLIHLPNYGTGNGLFVLLGMLYIFPMLLLYNQSLKYTVTVMCSSWIYTMMIFSISLRISYLLPETWFTPALLCVQSVIYLITLSSFLRFVKGKFVYILQNLTVKDSNALLRLCLAWFLGSVLLNFVMVVESPQILRLAVVILLAGMAIQCYRLFYSMVSANVNARTLHKNFRKDMLTQLKNRISFYEDAEELIRQKTSFSVFFIDLDHFKEINDRYGHLEGDRCLVHFSQTMENRFSNEGTLYRVSGDEFVFLYQNRDTSKFYRKLAGQKIQLPAAHNEYIHYSTGVASYPEDGDSIKALVASADAMMYRNKQTSHKPE